MHSWKQMKENPFAMLGTHSVYRCWMEPCSPPLAEPLLGGALIRGSQHSSAGSCEPRHRCQCSFSYGADVSWMWKSEPPYKNMLCLRGGVSDWKCQITNPFGFFDDADVAGRKSGFQCQTTCQCPYGSEVSAMAGKRGRIRLEL